MKNTFKALVMVLATVLIFTSVGIPVGAQGGIENGTTSPGEGQTLQGAGTIAAVPGGPGFIMVHPTAFVPMQSGWEYSFAFGGALYNPGSGGYIYGAAVNLPHGAKISKVAVYYYDNSLKNISVELATIAMDTVIKFQMAYLLTQGVDPSYRVMEDTSISPDIIDNQNYAYWIEVYIPGGESTGLTIRGIRIDYSYSVNLALINK